MKLLIVGASGTGKDTLARELCKAGLKQVISYTTRERRFPGEDTHIFVTPEEAKKYTDRVAETKIGKYEYFATRQQVEESDIYVIDPKGLYTLSSTLPNETFLVVYLTADREEALSHAISRGENEEKERKKCLERFAAEYEQFHEFEVTLATKKQYLPNVVQTFILKNDYKPETMKYWAEYCIIPYLRAHERRRR